MCRNVSICVLLHKVLIFQSSEQTSQWCELHLEGLIDLTVAQNTQKT